MAKHSFRNLSFLALTVFFMTACSSGSDDTTPKNPITPPVPTTGTINVSQSGSTATPENPAKSSAGTPATVTLSQSVSYQDPDGSTYRCEPKAVVTLTTGKQEVKVQSLKELTAISQSVNQTQRGQNPVTYVTTQTFTIGGQTLTFDLNHEVYTYTTSTKQQVEMPYLKLSAAKNGEAKAETRSISGQEFAVTGIRLIPVATRGSYTTEQTYEVHVSFTVDATAMNATTPQGQTLSFEASYTGVVETVNEYPDPQTTFAYTLTKQGTASTESPYTMNDKARQMTLEWDQVAQYTYFSVAELATKVVTREPKAKVTLIMEQDTVWAENKSEMVKVTTTDPQQTTLGSDPQVTTGKGIFEIGKQKITVDYSYDAYASMMVDEDEVSMPYLEAQKPEIENVSVRELDVVKVNGKDVRFYEVTVRITQELKSVNLAEPVSERVQYIVKYIGAEEIRLVKVTYRKSYEWEEAHDNIALAVFPIVYRDRTYSTGETFTDTFIDNGHFPEWNPSTAGDTREEMFITGEEMQGYVGDSIAWSNITIGVPDLSMIQIDCISNPFYQDYTPGTWSAYMLEKNYADAGVNFSLDGVQVIGADSVSTQPSGWYYFVPLYHTLMYQYIYVGEGCTYPYVGYMNLDSVKIDQYLVIDGQMINFLDFRGPYTFSYTEEDATMTDGSPAKVCTIKGENIFYGKYFSGTATITFYQYDKDKQGIAPSAANAQSMPQLQQPFAQYAKENTAQRPLHVVTNNPMWEDTPNIIRHNTVEEAKAALMSQM